MRRSTDTIKLVQVNPIENYKRLSSLPETSVSMIPAARDGAQSLHRQAEKHQSKHAIAGHGTATQSSAIILICH